MQSEVASEWDDVEGCEGLEKGVGWLPRLHRCPAITPTRIHSRLETGESVGGPSERTISCLRFFGQDWTQHMPT